MPAPSSSAVKPRKGKGTPPPCAGGGNVKGMASTIAHVEQRFAELDSEFGSVPAIYQHTRSDSTALGCRGKRLVRRHSNPFTPPSVSPSLPTDAQPVLATNPIEQLALEKKMKDEGGRKSKTPRQHSLLAHVAAHNMMKKRIAEVLSQRVRILEKHIEPAVAEMKEREHVMKSYQEQLYTVQKKQEEEAEVGMVKVASKVLTHFKRSLSSPRMPSSPVIVTVDSPLSVSQKSTPVASPAQEPQKLSFEEVSRCALAQETSGISTVKVGSSLLRPSHQNIASRNLSALVAVICTVGMDKVPPTPSGTYTELFSPSDHGVRMKMIGDPRLVKKLGEFATPPVPNLKVDETWKRGAKGKSRVRIRHRSGSAVSRAAARDDDLRSCDEPQGWFGNLDDTLNATLNATLNTTRTQLSPTPSSHVPISPQPAALSLQSGTPPCASVQFGNATPRKWKKTRWRPSPASTNQSGRQAGKAAMESELCHYCSQDNFARRICPITKRRHEPYSKKTKGSEPDEVWIADYRKAKGWQAWSRKKGNNRHTWWAQRQLVDVLRKKGAAESTLHAMGLPQDLLAGSPRNRPVRLWARAWHPEPPEHLSLGTLRQSTLAKRGADPRFYDLTLTVVLRKGYSRPQPDVLGPLRLAVILSRREPPAEVVLEDLGVDSETGKVLFETGDVLRTAEVLPWVSEPMELFGTTLHVTVLVVKTGEEADSVSSGPTGELLLEADVTFADPASPSGILPYSTLQHTLPETSLDGLMASFKADNEWSSLRVDDVEDRPSG